MVVRQHLKGLQADAMQARLRCLLKMSLGTFESTKLHQSGNMDFGWDMFRLESCIIGTKDGAFLTRSIRRNALTFNLNRCGEIETYSWEYGLVALGNKLVHSKRLSQPIALGIGAADPPQLVLEALHVQN